MNGDQPDNAAASTDPTVANELRELQALTSESPTPDAAQQAAETAAAQDRRAARVQHYAEKVRPFVEAYGARLRMPLDKIEVDKLSGALGDVGAEIIPEGEIDNEPHPWRNLLTVSLAIAIPRIVANVIERGKQDGAQGAPPAPARTPATMTKKPMTALEIAQDWDDGHGQPH